MTISGKNEIRKRDYSSATITVLSTRILQILCLIALYYPMSVGLTFYQKWFLKSYKFPLLVVAFHYIIKWTFAVFLRKMYRIVCGKERILLSLSECLRSVIPIGVAASVDIGLSNWALEYITVSLYTMAKSTCIIFILIFAVFLSLEKLQSSLVFTVLLISSGLFLFTYKSNQFDLTGFLLVEMAAICAGVRWTLSQLLMQREHVGLHNPIDMIYHVQPSMIISIIPLVFLFEGDKVLTNDAFCYGTKHEFAPFRIFTFVLIGGLVAFAMELAEYLLLLHTSGLTLSILGIIKETVTLILAHTFNGDVFSPINVVGLIFCLSGISLHTGFKACNEMASSSAMDIENNVEMELTESLLTVSDEEDLINEDITGDIN